MKAFSSYHPVVLFVYFLCVLTMAMFSWHPVLLALSLTGAVLFYLMLGRGRPMLRELGLYLMVFAAAAVTNPLFSHGGATPLFFLNGNAVTAEACLYGIAIGAMLVSVVFWFKAYSVVMSADKFLYLFGRAVPKLSLVLSMALRFIPLFRLQMRRVQNTQRAMGLYSEESYPDKARSSMRVFSAMVTWALENAVETGDSMKARGYGLRGRSHFSLFDFQKKDAAMLAVITVFAAGFAAAAAAGGAEFFYYPRTAELYTGYMSAAAYAAFGVLSFLPAFIEIKETIKWSYFKSRI